MPENTVVCISRQFGSGGHEIGLALAKSMGFDFYDKELLSQAADKSGILQEMFEKADEKPTSSLLYSLSAMEGGGKAPSYADYIGYMPNDQIQGVIAQVIREAAEKSSCVIIGRCADYILRGREKTLSVFIHAKLELRVPRIARLHNLDEDAARSLIRKTDRNRANYYSFYTDRDWNAADNYDLTLDGGRLDTAAAAQLIRNAVQLYCGA